MREIALGEIEPLVRDPVDTPIACMHRPVNSPMRP